MSKRKTCETIHSDEFRVELQPTADGPTLTVSGQRHDSEFTLIVRGVEGDGSEEQEQETAQIIVTIANLEELVRQLKAAVK